MSILYQPCDRSMHCALACLAALAAGCDRTVGIFPSEACRAQQVLVELTADDSFPPTHYDTYHSTAACTIVFDVREYHVFVPDSSDPRWTPAYGLDYELRVEPEGPQGRLETGRLPGDGRVTAETVEGNTQVILTVYVPSATNPGVIYDQVAVVELDGPVDSPRP